MTDIEPVDWRGTPITPGALVIYGGPVGRSIQMVEAVVADPMLTPSGRIWLNIVRRSYTDDSDKRVHVGADRLTVVDVLPRTTLPTATEAREERERCHAARQVYVLAAHETEQHGGEPWGHYEKRTRTLTGGYAWHRDVAWDEYVSCDGCTAANKRFQALWEAGDLR